jgi:hypothetical protein
MSQPLVSSSLAILVDNFMNNITELKIQADLIEDDGTLFEDKLIILEDVITNLENEMRRPKRYVEQLEKNILLAQELERTSDSHRDRLREMSQFCPSSESTGAERCALVTQFELDQCPSYVKGRASIERINDVVRSINKIIAQHASIMAVPINKMEPSQLQRYRAIKLLYSENTKGQDVFGENELNLKMDQTNRSILLTLQHLGRIKDVASSNSMKTYSLVQ